MWWDMWTPAALSSEARERRSACWRFVEDQHRISTMRLVDTLDEQRTLEELLDASKPPVPQECRHLHYLLFTPFRYRPVSHGSRFRRAGDRRGVLYAAETMQTALHEVAFYRLLFLAESPSMKVPKRPASMTAFAFQNGPARTVDLTAQPFSATRGTWESLSDYHPCQTFADIAREAGIEAIRYRSVRHAGGFNLAVLTCARLSGPTPGSYRQWFLLADRGGVSAWAEHPDRQSVHVPLALFEQDPRLASLRR
jgi:RES domain